jgi:glycosyltransferase involved in cell wall biosynthesis
MEAQSCGVPVVAARVGAVAEVIGDHATGFVVPPQRPDLLAEKTLQLLSDAGLRARMGAEGREAAVERFDADRSAEVYVQAYEAALAHAATRR